MSGVMNDQTAQALGYPSLAAYLAAVQANQASPPAQPATLSPQAQPAALAPPPTPNTPSPPYAPVNLGAAIGGGGSLPPQAIAALLGSGGTPPAQPSPPPVQPASPTPIRYPSVSQDQTAVIGTPGNPTDAYAPSAMSNSPPPAQVANSSSNGSNQSTNSPANPIADPNRDYSQNPYSFGEWSQKTASLETGNQKDPYNAAGGGKYQIEPDQFDTLQKANPQLINFTYSDAQSDPAKQELVAKAQFDHITQTLQNAGLSLTPTNYDIIHHFGDGGGVSVLTANPNTPLTDIIKNHGWSPDLFADAKGATTAGDIINYTQNNRNQGSPASNAGGGATLPAQSTSQANASPANFSQTSDMMSPQQIMAGSQNQPPIQFGNPMDLVKQAQNQPFFSPQNLLRLAQGFAGKRSFGEAISGAAGSLADQQDDNLKAGIGEQQAQTGQANAQIANRNSGIDAQRTALQAQDQIVQQRNNVMQTAQKIFETTGVPLPQAFQMAASLMAGGGSLPGAAPQAAAAMSQGQPSGQGGASSPFVPPISAPQPGGELRTPDGGVIQTMVPKFGNQTPWYRMPDGSASATPPQGAVPTQEYQNQADTRTKMNSIAYNTAAGSVPQFTSALETGNRILSLLPQAATGNSVLQELSRTIQMKTGGSQAAATAQAQALLNQYAVPLAKLDLNGMKSYKFEAQKLIESQGNVDMPPAALRSIVQQGQANLQRKVDAFNAYSADPSNVSKTSYPVFEAKYFGSHPIADSDNRPPISSFFRPPLQQASNQ